MKFKAPADTGSANIGGQQFEVVDGILETPDEGNYISLLASHGFTFISESAPEEQAAEGDAQDKPKRAYTKKIDKE